MWQLEAPLSREGGKRKRGKIERETQIPFDRRRSTRSTITSPKTTANDHRRTHFPDAPPLIPSAYTSDPSTRPRPIFRLSPPDRGTDYSPGSTKLTNNLRCPSMNPDKDPFRTSVLQVSLFFLTTWERSVGPIYIRYTERSLTGHALVCRVLDPGERDVHTGNCSLSSAYSSAVTFLGGADLLDQRKAVFRDGSSYFL